MRPKPRWKVGIVGVGKIGGGWDRPEESGPVRSHAQAYHRHPEFQLVAAADPDGEALSDFQGRWGIEAGYRSAEEMQDREALDVVSICSPDETHYAVAAQLLGSRVAPRALFVEKPVCLDRCELKDLSRVSDQAGVAVVVNHTRRFDPAHRRLAEVVQSGDLGGLLWGRWSYFGGWTHNGVHLIDTLRMLFGEEPGVASVVAAAGGRPGDENLDVQLSIGKGIVAAEAFDESYYQLFDGELRFDKGSARLLDFGSTITIERVAVNELRERVLTPIEESPLTGLDSYLYHAVDAVDAHLQGQGRLEELGVGLSDAAQTMRVVWEARDMARAELSSSHT